MQRATLSCRPRLSPGPPLFAGSSLRPRLPRVRRAPQRPATTCEASMPGLPALSSYDDETKEKSRQYRRTVFTFDSWAEHRSTERYWRHMSGMLSSRVVRGLSKPLIWVAGVATAIAIYNTARGAGLLPAVLPELGLESSSPFQLSSFALSLLLVFRTNSSYARWLDARKTWGLVLNRSRDITRQGLSFFPEDQPALRAMLCRWVPAFSRTLMCHVRQDGNLELELQGVLLPHEVEEVLLAQHRPNHVLQVLSSIIKAAKLPTSANVRLDENLTTFEDCLGTCERILKTPIPLSYTRHTSRFMMLYLTLLPFTLWESCQWTAIPLSTLIAFLLLGIEEIGVSIEEPFSILALEAICDSALSNVRELHATHSARSSGGAGAGGGGNGAGAPRRPLSGDELVQVTLGMEEPGPETNRRGPMVLGAAVQGSGGGSGGASVKVGGVEQ